MAKLFFTLLLIVVSVCTKAQNVGIGTTLPKARLHVTDSAVLFTGPTTLPSLAGLPPVSGGGTRLMWYPSKAAFRAGYAGTAATTVWNEANIGNYSFGTGYGGVARGTYSATIGFINDATGIASIAAGYDNSATGNYATAIGYGLLANSQNSMVVGQYNDTVGNNSGNSWVPTDPLFLVGNGQIVDNGGGQGVIQRSNAFEIQKNGIVKIKDDLRVGDLLTVTGNTTLQSKLNVQGSVLLSDNVTMTNNLTIGGKLNVDTINNVKNISTTYTSGTAPILNLVPIGIVSFYRNYNRNITFDDCFSGFTNLAGNLITIIGGGCAAGNGPLDGGVDVTLYFNSTIAAAYKEIIAAPSVEHTGIGATGNAQISTIFSEVNKNASGVPISYTTGYKAGDMPEIGVFHVKGTVVFYGLKD
jgi:hypothetical protein